MRISIPDQAQYLASADVLCKSAEDSGLVGGVSNPRERIKTIIALPGKFHEPAHERLQPKPRPANFHTHLTEARFCSYSTRERIFQIVFWIF